MQSGLGAMGARARGTARVCIHAQLMRRIPDRQNTSGERHCLANEREQIAQAAAALIIESGIADWQFARRKAARQLGLGERARLPDRTQLEAALREYAALYLADEQPGLLDELRAEALQWMEKLEEFDPELTGPVAEGWAYPGCEIRLELLADDAKVVEIALLNRGIDVTHLPGRAPGAGPVSMHADGETGRVRLVVQDVGQRRNRKHDRVRKKVAELRALVG
jgi:hypothetical protein